MNKIKNKPLIIDTSALIVGFDPSSIDSEQYTVPLVEEELKGSYILLSRLKTAVNMGKLKIKKPKQSFLEDVESHSKRVGDYLFLSETDKYVLALALELKSAGRQPIILTDDYSIQNLADSMGIEFKSLSMLGIKFRYVWTLYCAACGKEYPPKRRVKFCEVCGTKLTFKHTRREPIEDESR
ncbi:MAG: ribonuclease VapC [Candidatus Bathyarchaeia archaeon]